MPREYHREAVRAWYNERPSEPIVWPDADYLDLLSA